MARAYHHGEVREAAIRSALALVEERGEASMTMRAVAGRVGVDHRAIYRHFSDRETLLGEAAATGYGDLLAILRQPGELRELTRDFARAIGFALARPHLYSLMLSQPRDRIFTGGALEQAVRALLSHLTASGQAALGDAASSEQVRDLVFAALGSSYGLISLASSLTLAERSPEALEAFLIKQVSAVIEGQKRLLGSAG